MFRRSLINHLVVPFLEYLFRNNEVNKGSIVKFQIIRVRHMYENDKIYLRFVKFLLFYIILYTIHIHKNDWKKKEANF